MTAAATIEDRDIHLSACRYRRQGLLCSTCAEVVERAARIIEGDRRATQIAA